MNSAKESFSSSAHRRTREMEAFEETKYALEMDKIKKVMMDTVEKIQIVLCIPLLLTTHVEQLVKCVGPKEFEEIHSAFSSKELKSISSVGELSMISTITSVERIINSFQLPVKQLQKRDDENVCRAIYKVLKNEEVIKLCKDKLLDKISSQGNELITCLKNVLNLILTKMTETPDEAERKEIELHRMFQYNEIAYDTYEALKQEYVIQTKANHARLNKCDAEIALMEKRMEDVKKSCKEAVTQYITEAEKQMTWDWKLSEYKQEEYAEECKKTDAQLERMKKDNFANEKELRVKRYKVEQQLKTFLQKYDEDMDERQDQHDELKAFFDEEEKTFNELQVKIDEQEIEYRALMAEKLEYEKRVWNEKLHLIQCKIAARKIQRYFRAFLFLVKEYNAKKKKKK